MNQISLPEPLCAARERLAVQLSQKFFAEITGVNLGTLAEREPQPERRVHTRIAFDRRARISPLMEGVGEGGSAILIRDISVGGIGFLHAEPVSMGDEFVLRLLTAADEPIDIQCAARHCEMGGTCGSQFVVGATFELVLNRPMADWVAPESEMPAQEQPLVDQPAAPSIEQRYDQQCLTSRLIRPIIRETRWDRWMAKPAIQKITRLFARVFWPVLLLWKGISAVLRAGEESRIRSRLTPSRSGKRRRTKNRSAGVKTPAPAVKTTQPPQRASPVEAASSPAPHASLFGTAEATTAPAAITPPVAGSARKSLFSGNDVVAGAEPQALAIVTPPAPVVEPVVAQPVPVAEPITAANPIAAVPAPPAAEPENKPPLQPQPALAPIQPAAREELREESTNESGQEPRVQPVAEPANPPTAAPPIAAGDPPSRQDDQTRSEPASPKARPPVAHPRQIRRRSRPTFHR